MTPTSDTTTPHSASPGPGTWKRDAAHFPRRCSPIVAKLYETAFSDGFTRGAERYGIPLRSLAYRNVDGWLYNQPHPLGAPLGAAPPPAFVLWLVSRLHPAYRARREAARDGSRLLAEDVRRWFEVQRPERIAAHLELLAEDPDGFDDAGLLDHLHRCLEVHAASVYIHGTLTVAANIGVGRFVDHVMMTAGAAVDEVLRAMHGDSPVSTGDELTLRELVASVRNDVSATALVTADDVAPEEILARLAAAPAPVGPAAQAWLDTAGQRVLDVYDVLQPRALEVPYLLVATLRFALAGSGKPERREDTGTLADLRARSDDVATFDRLLADAHASLSIRDERVLYNDYWSAGVTRRALLALGGRLVARGVLQRSEHVLVAELSELDAMTPGVADRLAERWESWQVMAPHPEVLGRPDPGDPPVAPFAEPHRSSLRAVLLCLELAFDERHAPEDAVIRGFGAATGSIEGPARVVLGPEDFERVQLGDVVITASTSPTWNVVLPLLSGLVTERGGLLCHAAIVAREFGIPAVVGTGNATQRIPDGARVHVDGLSGEVRVVTGVPV